MSVLERAADKAALLLSRQLPGERDFGLAVRQALYTFQGEDRFLTFRKIAQELSRRSVAARRKASGQLDLGL